MPDLRIFYTVYFIIRGREVCYGRSWKNLACHKSQSLKELCRLLRPGTLIASVLDLARSPLVLRSFVGCNFKKSYSQSLLPHPVTLTDRSQGWLLPAASKLVFTPSTSCRLFTRHVHLSPSSASHLITLRWCSHLLSAQQQQIHHTTTTSVIRPLFRSTLVGRPAPRT